MADYTNCRIQKFSSSGAYVSKWGTQGNGNGQFTFPTGLAIDAVGHVYVADSYVHRIQKFTSSGTYLTQWGVYGWGGGPGVFIQFRCPAGVAVDASGNVYVADESNWRIQKFTSGGAFLTMWGTQGTGNGQLQSPEGVALDVWSCPTSVDGEHLRNHRALA